MNLIRCPKVLGISLREKTFMYPSQPRTPQSHPQFHVVIATARWLLSEAQVLPKSKRLWSLLCMVLVKFFPLKNKNRTRIKTRYDLTQLVWVQARVGEDTEKLEHYL